MNNNFLVLLLLVCVIAASASLGYMTGYSTGWDVAAALPFEALAKLDAEPEPESEPEPATPVEVAEEPPERDIQLVYEVPGEDDHGHRCKYMFLITDGGLQPWRAYCETHETRPFIERNGSPVILENTPEVKQPRAPRTKGLFENRV